MKITVTVSTRSRRPGIEERADGSYLIRVSAPPREGRANEEVVDIIAAHFHVPKSHLRLLRGAGSKRKIIDIIV